MGCFCRVYITENIQKYNINKNNHRYSKSTSQVYSEYCETIIKPQQLHTFSKVDYYCIFNSIFHDFYALYITDTGLFLCALLHHFLK